MCKVLEQIVSKLWFPWQQIAPIGLQLVKLKKSSLNPQGQELLFCMYKSLVVPTINCANHGPGVIFDHATGVDNLHRLTMGKYSNINLNISKARSRIWIKLHTQHHWSVEKVAYCFWTDQTGSLVAMTTYTF